MKIETKYNVGDLFYKVPVHNSSLSITILKISGIRTEYNAKWFPGATEIYYNVVSITGKGVNKNMHEKDIIDGLANHILFRTSGELEKTVIKRAKWLVAKMSSIKTEHQRELLEKKFNQ